MKQAVIQLISHQLQIRKILRFSVILSGEYVKYDELGGIDETVSCFLRSQSKIVLLVDKRYIKRYVAQSFKEIEDRNENFLATGTGWVLNQINYANIEIGRLTLSGGCSDIKVKWNVPFCKRKFLVDVESFKNNCFFNSVAVDLLDKKMHKLSPAKLGMVTRAYVKQNVNVSNLKLPLSLEDVHIFERKNKHLKIHINIFANIDGLIIPVHKSKTKQNEKIINIFLAKGKHSTEYHYIFISDLNKFLRKQENCNNFHCPSCLNSFTSESALSNHAILCSQLDPIRVQYPPEGAVVEFSHHDKQVLHPVFGCCDFEAALVPVTQNENSVHFNCDVCAQSGGEDNSKKCPHKTTLLHHQVPTTYCILIVDKFGEILFEKTESGNTNVLKKKN